MKGLNRQKGQNGENDAVGSVEWDVEWVGDIFMWRNRGRAERKGARTSHHKKGIWHMANTAHTLGTVPRSDSIVPALGKSEKKKKSGGLYSLACRLVAYGTVYGVWYFLYGTRTLLRTVNV